MENEIPIMKPSPIRIWIPKEIWTQMGMEKVMTTMATETGKQIPKEIVTKKS